MKDSVSELLRPAPAHALGHARFRARFLPFAIARSASAWTARRTGALASRHLARFLN